MQLVHQGKLVAAAAKPTAYVSNGMSQLPVTVQVHDQGGNQITSGGGTLLPYRDSRLICLFFIFIFLGELFITSVKHT